MKDNYEILEVRGYSGTYVLQNSGKMQYKAPTSFASETAQKAVIFGDAGGKYDAHYYLDSEKFHYIQTVKRDSDDEWFSLGDKTSVGTIGKFTITDDGELWVSFEQSNTPSLRIEHMPNKEENNINLLIL